MMASADDAGRIPDPVERGGNLSTAIGSSGDERSTSAGDPPTDAVAEGMLREGMMLANRFRLVRPAGEGSIGVVWVAEDTHLDDEQVACKILREEFSRKREAIAALKREVLLTRKLRHPNILGVYTFWETDPAAFITMEYVDGRSLAEALADRGRPFTVKEILPWLRELSDALDYAHGQGVLHRDVKPANILLDNDGHVRLADFGIASMALDPDAENLDEKPVGTLYFISPERLTGGRPDSRSDLYSIAASFYQLISGAPPFHGGDVIAQIQIKPAQPIDHLPPEANRVLLRALSKSPTKRHLTCGDFYNAFSRTVVGVSSSSSPQALVALGDDDRSTVVLGDYEVGTRRTRLGRLLIEQGLITQDQLADALMDQSESGEKLGAILVRLGHVQEASIAATMSKQLQIPLIRVEQEEIDVEVALSIGRDVAEKALAVPMRRSQYGVLVAMVDPLDMETINNLEAHFGENVDPLVAIEAEVRRVIERIYAAE